MVLVDQPDAKTIVEDLDRLSPESFTLVYGCTKEPYKRLWEACGCNCAALEIALSHYGKHPEEEKLDFKYMAHSNRMYDVEVIPRLAYEVAQVITASQLLSELSDVAEGDIGEQEIDGMLNTLSDLVSYNLINFFDKNTKPTITKEGRALLKALKNKQPEDE